MNRLDRVRLPARRPKPVGFRASPPVLMLILVGLPLLVGPRKAPAQPTDPAPASTPAAASASTQPSPAQLVVKIVGQTGPEERRQAAVQILKMASPDGVRALLDIFGTENNETAKTAVCRAIEEVGSTEPAFREPLLALLNAKEVALRSAAAAALRAYRDDPQVSGRLAELERQMLERDLDELAREVYALLPGEPERAERLQLWLGSSRPVLRLTALKIVHETLGKKNGELPGGVLQRLRTMLDDPDEAVRTKLVEVLRDVRKVEDARLLEARLPQERSVPVRELIYNGLGHIRDPRSIPVCIAGLKDPVDSVAARAASALAELAQVTEPASVPEALKPAVQGLLNRITAGIASDELRKSVIDAMTGIADPKFLEVLARHAGGGEPVPAIRQAALRGIGRIGNPASAALVVERLAAEQDPAIRETAVEALGRLGSTPDHLAALGDRLDAKVEPSPAVREKAWEAYRLVFSRLAPKDQLQAVDSWPDQAIRLVADPQLPQELLASVASRLLTVARQKGEKDPKAALALLDKLAQAVPADRAAPNWAKELEQARRQFQAATRPASAAAGG